MSTLHTINKSWHDASWLFEQLAFASKGDAILLIEDGVLAVQSAVLLASFAAKCQLNDIEVFVLKNDTQLRGISNQHKEVKEIDYAEWVNLVEQHELQCAW